MHNYDDKYPARPGFEPGTSRLRAPVDTNESSVPVHRHSRGQVRRGQSGVPDTIARLVLELPALCYQGSGFETLI